MFFPHILNNEAILLPNYRVDLLLPHALVGMHKNMSSTFSIYHFLVSETKIPLTYYKSMQGAYKLMRFNDDDRINKFTVDRDSPESDYGIYFAEYQMSISSILDLILPLLFLATGILCIILLTNRKSKKPSYLNAKLSIKTTHAILLIGMILILQGGVTNLLDFKYQLNEQGFIQLDGWDPIKHVLIQGCYFLLFRIIIEAAVLLKNYYKMTHQPYQAVIPVHIVYCIACYVFSIAELGIISIPYSLYIIKLCLFSIIIAEIQICVLIYNNHMIALASNSVIPQENVPLSD
jgi:hypothetical protein